MRPGPRRSGAVVALILAVYTALCLHGLAWDTPTVDEFAHLPAGYYYLQTGDFTHYALNPPLVRIMSALPLLALRPAISTDPPPEVGGWYPWLFATDFMERNRAAFDRIFLAGRLPIVVIGLLLALLVYRWARELYGERAGLLALSFFALNPSVIAHAHLATVDVGAAAFMTLAVYAFSRFLGAPSLATATAAGVALGFAQLTKFTAVLLYPILGLLVLTQGRAMTVRRLGAFAAVVALSLVVLDAGYLFQGVGTPLARLSLGSRSWGAVAEAVPAWVPSPLPVPYVLGSDNLQALNERGEFPNYLFGRWADEGWASYYLVAILFKTPLPLLLAWLVAPFAPLRHRREERVLWLPLVALVAAFSLLSRINYGIRYVLPALPLACIYASRLAPWLATRAVAVRRGALLLALAYPLSAVLASPDTIAYFNVLAGGRGDEILLDSNLDWGQGLKRLKAYMDRHAIERVDLAYFGHVDPALYGIAWEFPEPSRPGPIAVSANFLHGYPYATYADGQIVSVPFGAFTWVATRPRRTALGGGLFLFEP